MAKRLQYHFVLSKEEADSDLKEQMDKLKGQKQLTAKIKAALSLLMSLEQGDTSLLDAMFPEIRAAVKPSTPPPTPPNGELQRMIADTVQASVKEAMQNFPALPAGKLVAEPAFKQAGQGIGTLSGHTFSLPLDDDDELPQMTMKLSPLSSAKNGNNLLSGILGLD